jgi:hypothetical protein
MPLRGGFKYRLQRFIHALRWGRLGLYILLIAESEERAAISIKGRQ